MKNSKKCVGLFLTGGLGNQLFQFAAALDFSQGREICIYESLGSPRSNSEGEPELFSFKVEEIANIRRKKEASHFLSKSSGYLLRSNIWPKKLERIMPSRILLKCAGMLSHLILQRKMFYPVVISDVGYEKIKFNKLLQKICNPFLIGYFQSAIWPESVKPLLSSLELRQEGPMLKALRKEAALIPPIIIHVRRGDYKVESTFGLPAEKYYLEAMRIVESQFASHPIWVFSDEEVEAQKILSWMPESRLRFISDVDGESSASLMAMRFGCAYVIANSTFSWWGAYLSKAESPLVVAPSPWFTGQKEPNLIIPPHWVRVDHQ